MAPIWIRKHRELVPCVFVLVLRLYEFGIGLEGGNVGQRDAGSLGSVAEDGGAGSAGTVGPLEKEKVERLRDNELVNEILNRKRSCTERGIKLAVVLLTSREMLGEFLPLISDLLLGVQAFSYLRRKVYDTKKA